MAFGTPRTMNPKNHPICHSKLMQVMQCIKMVQNNKVQLAMPRIGCGLDMKVWSKVRQTVDNQDTDITITVLIPDLETGSDFSHAFANGPV